MLLRDLKILKADVIGLKYQEPKNDFGKSEQGETGKGVSRVFAILPERKVDL